MYVESKVQEVLEAWKPQWVSQQVEYYKHYYGFTQEDAEILANQEYKRLTTEKKHD